MSDREIVNDNNDADVLQKKLEIYRAIARNIPECVFGVVDHEMRYLVVEGLYLEQLGIASEEFVGRKPGDVLKGPQLEVVQEGFRLALAGATRVYDELLFNDRWFRTEFVPLRDEENRILAAMGFGYDITERRETEDRLRESEKRYHSLYDRSPDGILLIGTGGVIVDFNESAHRQLGYTREEFLKLKLSDIDPFETPEDVEASIQKVLQQGKAEFEVTHRTKQGEFRNVHVITQVIHLSGTPMFHTIWRDVTEIKRAEKAIRESEEKYRILVETADDAILLTDLEGNQLFANRAYYTSLGYEPGGNSAPDFGAVHPDDASLVKKNIGELIERGSLTVEYRVQHRQGHSAYRFAKSTLIRDEAGRPKAVLSVIRDMTERKRTEEKILQNEEFIRNILNTVDEGFIVVDRNLKIMTANKAYCVQAGMRWEDVIGSKCHEISHGSSKPCYELGEECPVKRVLDTGRPHTAVHRHWSADQQVIFVESKAYPLKDGSGAVTAVIETINNITEKHLLEEERLKTQKLEAIGTLAGGIAHDFNNLLQGVFGYISLAKLTLEHPERSLSALEQAEKALHLSVNLTSQLLTFSKGGKPVKKPTLLGPVIENAAKFALSGSRSDYRIAADEQLRLAEVDEGQIGQVIQNIVLNADQAMPQGGTVDILARNVPPEQAAKRQGLANGDYVAITIRDTGIGIPEPYLSRIFDPYFTTKEKGSGLGLATSYSIIKNHGGVIEIESESGKGSSFTIYLPASSAKAKTRQKPSPPRPARTGRILLMDDEEIIRNVAGELIRALGHDVEFAENGDSAIARYRSAKEAGRPFDVVILDLTIRRGMGGAEAFIRLREIDPDVKAVVSSGYSDDTAIAEYRQHGFKAFLKKPYHVGELQDILNQLLS